MSRQAIILGAILLGFVSVLSYAQAPVPFVNLPLVPDATPPGGAQFALTVNGTGFVSNSVVNWNGTPLATQFVSQGQLTATVPAANITTANTASVTVVSPAPGGGTSNVAFFTVTSSAQYLAFNVASSITVGSGPTGMAAGDFNGDGKLDLAVINNCYGAPNCNVNWPGTVSIFLGDGTGNFTLTSTVSTGEWTWPSSIAVGDFNGDGKLDLAVTSSSTGGVSILLGDGTGNFTLTSQPGTGNYFPQFVAVGDFNGDGNLDLAVANEGEGYSSVSILLGDGTGNFNLYSSVAVGDDPVSLAVGDFNGDGKLDLAVASLYSNTLTILLGDGTGNFTPYSFPSAGSYVSSVVTGDFNGDGKLDLAATSGSLWILMGDGTGNFSLTSTLEGYDVLNSALLADFNGDNNLDVAVDGYYFSHAVVFLGDGKGDFNLNASPPTGGSGPIALAVGDFNGDGKLDLAALNAGSNTVTVLLQVPPYPIATLSQTSLSFAPQLVGTNSSPQIVTLTNTGSAALKVGKIAINSQGNFLESNNCPSELTPGEQCAISVTFDPTRVGSLKGALTINDNATNSPQTVSLTGVGIVATLLPSNLNFGNQLVNTTTPPQQVTLTNYGTQALTIYGIHIQGADGGAFAQTNNCGTSVPAGGNCVINITFTPGNPGSDAVTLTVGDNGGASPQTVSLSGTGIPTVTLAPSNLYFGDQQAGTTSPPQQVTLTNYGTQALTIYGIYISGKQARNFGQTNDCGATVAVGGSCTISVTFSPVNQWWKAATLEVKDDGPPSPQTVALSGIGTD